MRLCVQGKGCSILAGLLGTLFTYSMALPCLGFDEQADPDRFRARVIAERCADPMQMAVLDEHSLVYIERRGRVIRVDLERGTKTELAQLPVAMFGEVGLMGIAPDPDFAANSWLYLCYCPASQSHTIRVSRFTVVGDQLDLSSEKMLLDWAIDVEGAIHMGGGLAFDSKGNLIIGTGDNCPPIPELPVDVRPGRENFDALRTSANSKDLRGKILRIRPREDGTYEIPEGNLFTDESRGRPEIYAMGCRNPFRVSVDLATDAVYWGDVGPNIDLSLGIGPNGYDEINRASQAGNYGWPMFVGPNEVYRDFDFATRKPLEPFNVAAPVNPSRNNTGISELPAPQKALIWYPSSDSPEFPWTGSGGRSAMAGPVYHASRYANHPLRMPESWDGRLLVFDWTRNWIYAVAMNEAGEPYKAERLLPDHALRKPIDVVLGPSGELYVLEFGNLWGNNEDGSILRVEYVRGNRPPQVALQVDPPAGRHPLRVTADATQTTDPDGDSISSWEWTIDGQVLGESTSRVSFTLDSPGEHRVSVRVVDSEGAEAATTRLIQVGNAPPQVQFVQPRTGSIIDPGMVFPYELLVTDTEEGSTSDRTIASSRVLMESRFSRRLSRGADPLLDDSDPGLVAMRATTCFSCHTAKAASAGPAYHAVAKRYASDSEAREKLAMKVVQGGAGVWGDKPMPPHPQHSIDDVLPMIDWILSLAIDQSEAPVAGQAGYFRPTLTAPSEGGVWTLIGSYTDQGAPEASALRGEARVRLHSRRKRAPYFDRSSDVQWVDIFEHGIGMAGRFTDGGWISCDEIDLSTIDRVRVRVAAAGDHPVALELRLDSPDGERIGQVQVEPKHDALGAMFTEVTLAIKPIEGLHDLYLVAARSGSSSNSLQGTDSSPKTRALAAQDTVETFESWCLALSWVEFLESPVAMQEREKEAAQRKQILLVATALDHPFATHMYREVCNILAACLNQHPGIEAIVAREDDFPTDPELLDRVDAVVFYSRPAGDIVLGPVHREAFEKMLKRGVGFTAIHWATGAETQVGERYESILGGWFNFEFSGIKVDRRPLVQTQVDHAICRGWNGYELRDEFYLNLRYSPKAEPVLTVDVDGKEQCVAWVLNRDDGGRSFGTTLGHFHDNYAIPEFRRMLVNGILWTAGVEVPESGSLVDVTPESLTLTEPKPVISHAWTTDELHEKLDELTGAPSFERGAKLFESASCAACHRLGSLGSALGPDLHGIRVRMAATRDPWQSLLREVVEPSAVIAENYRTQIVRLDTGETRSGLVVEQTEDVLVLATDPTRPMHRETLSRDSIEESVASDVSLMPTGLLDRLSPSEILDLLTFVEAEGDPEFFAYQSRSRTIEPWGDRELVVQEGLSWWLDARALNAGRVARGLGEIQDGGLIDQWPDASGFRRDVSQRVQLAQPRLDLKGTQPVVVMDGVDDWLGAGQVGLRARDATVLVVVAPSNNEGWPGIVSGNMRQRNDYQTGFNIDLMPETTESWQTIMVEGPGFIGVQNLMRESHPFDQFQIVALRTQPGIDTVQLRINGRPQGSRGRDEGEMVIDELAVGARYWSNDAGIPPYNRGFLKGRYAAVLFYERALQDDELSGLESYLWGKYQPLLESEVSR